MWSLAYFLPYYHVISNPLSPTSALPLYYLEYTYYKYCYLYLIVVSGQDVLLRVVD